MSFRTIRNNTALKHSRGSGTPAPRFGTIRNKTALKPQLNYTPTEGEF
nr:hypothetical protein [Streptococcus oralis]MBS9402009.1 hypothetical protein [Streptococcus oralis]